MSRRVAGRIFTLSPYLWEARRAADAEQLLVKLVENGVVIPMPMFVGLPHEVRNHATLRAHVYPQSKYGTVGLEYLVVRLPTGRRTAETRLSTLGFNLASTMDGMREWIWEPGKR